MNADRRGSAPYGERTSDKWVHVRRKATSFQASGTGATVCSAPCSRRLTFRLSLKWAHSSGG